VATKIGHIREATYNPELSMPSATEFYLATKRLFDIALSATLLVLLAPLMALIALAIRLDSPGPVIFRQKRVLGSQRPGDLHPERNVFEFFKFRSMHCNADEKMHQQYMAQLINGQNAQGEALKMHKLARDPRITRIGRFLRKTSLDELPQLVNILRGDMTFVGPRPPIPYEVAVYKTWHLRRLEVAQGLTGLWQVKGRNSLSFDEMVELDIEYARRRSLWLDVWILLATIPAVIICRGVR
jgi:lipopolysaccharide/colanic/teichoic acid biosynthesis glycosyltransferase